MPRSSAIRHRNANNPAAASGSAHLPNTISPHPVLIALACLLGRSAAREVIASMDQASPAGTTPATR